MNQSRRLWAYWKHSSGSVWQIVEVRDSYIRDHDISIKLMYSDTDPDTSKYSGGMKVGDIRTYPSNILRAGDPWKPILKEDAALFFLRILNYDY